MRKIKCLKCNFILSKKTKNKNKVKWGIFCVEAGVNNFSPELHTLQFIQENLSTAPCWTFVQQKQFCFSLTRTVSEGHLRTSQTSCQAATVPRVTLWGPLKQRKRIKNKKGTSFNLRIDNNNSSCAVMTGYWWHTVILHRSYECRHKL